jgi:glyoxylase-like metal-dependent hydrolase (beta-lactamase superfamily II)
MKLKDTTLVPIGQKTEEHMGNVTRRNLIAGAAAVTALPSLAAPRAQAAAPLAEKQNPGWYRYKVGSFEVTAVTDGANTNPLSDSYVGNAPKNDVNAALVANHLPPDKVTHAYTPVVVNTGSKLVVIDTGLGLGMYQQSKGAVGQFHTNLAAAGVDRNAVDVVIISHFHGDHINGLLGADSKLAFPNAEVMVPASEWAFWMDDANAARFPEPIKGQFANVKRVFGALANKPTQYEAGKELVPGITSMATPGHTPGHASHILASGSDKGPDPSRCDGRRRHAVSQPSRVEVGLRHGRAAGGADPPQGLRHGDRGQDADPGIPLPVPGPRLCREIRLGLSAGAGGLESDDLTIRQVIDARAAAVVALEIPNFATLNPGYSEQLRHAGGRPRYHAKRTA